jgi:nucleoid DNA-binding protein
MSIKEKKSNFLNNLKEVMSAQFGDNVTKADAARALAAVEQTFKAYMAEAVNAEETIEIPFMGTYMKCTFIPAHSARNPRNGETVDVPARFSYRLASKPKNVDELDSDAGEEEESGEE